MALKQSPILEYLLPEYRRIFPNLFTSKVPEETRATCSDCRMCDSSNAYPAELDFKFFNPTTKCCTYYPTLSNYLVGGILSSSDPTAEEGRKRLRLKIQEGIGVHPRGLLIPKKYFLLYDQAFGFFGRAESMVCPYYDKGNCTIWRYRESTCTTWFCKYVRGEKSKNFWEELKRYLALAERELSMHCVKQLIFNTDQLCEIWDTWDKKAPVTAEDLDDKPAPETVRRALWKDWYGREEEYYIQCYEHFSKVDRVKFLEITGVEESFYREKLKRAVEKVSSEEIPQHLRKNPELAAFRQGDHYVCASPANKGDAFEIPATVFPKLDLFDGVRANGDVLREIKKEYKLELSSTDLETLYHLGVLC